MVPHHEAPPNLYSAASIKYFFKILEIARKNNITVILIQYPMSKEYIGEIVNHNIFRKEY